MKEASIMRRRISVPILVVIVLGLAGRLSAQEKYTARLMTRGGPNSEPVIKLQIIIDSYTTGPEAWRLQQILEFSGYDPFIAAFREVDKGSISFYGTRGLKVNIHVAEVLPTEKGRKILLFTERQAWDVDVLQRMDGRFPYMVVELNVDNRGKGDGKIYENAQIRFNGDKASGTSTLELETYNSAPKVLFGVQLVK
jgi:hypothetical protein